MKAGDTRHSDFAAGMPTRCASGALRASRSRLSYARQCWRLGCAPSSLQTCSKAMKGRIRDASIAARKKAATERLEARRLHIEWAFRQQSRYGAYRPLSFSEAAQKLNERGIES